MKVDKEVSLLNMRDFLYTSKFIGLNSELFVCVSRSVDTTGFVEQEDTYSVEETHGHLKHAIQQVHVGLVAFFQCRRLVSYQ